MALPILSEYRTLIRAALSDAGAAVWAEADIDAGLRMALAELTPVYGAAALVKDLDSAAATNVEAVDTGVVVTGAAGHCCEIRGIFKVERHNESIDAPGQYLNAAVRLLEAYKYGLRMVRARLGAKAATVPYTQVYDDEQEDTDLLSAYS